MKKYYLETNAIRTLSKKLDSDWTRENCFSSLHTIVELLTDLTEGTYVAKRAALRNIENFKIKIDWRQPQKIELDSFRIGAVYKIEKDDVSDIMECMIESESLVDFETALKDNSLVIAYDYLKNLDQSYNSYFPSEIASKNAEFRGEFEFNFGKDIVDELQKKVDVASPTFERNTQKLFIEATIKKIAGDLAESGFNTQKVSADQIERQYDGAIDTFIFASAYYSVQKVAFNEGIAKNDFTDLYHCMYLGKDVILVTNDRLLLETLNRYDRNCAMSCDAFELKMAEAK